MARILLLTCVAVFLAATLKAQEWSGWRGPARDGSVPASLAPKSWPASLPRAWRTEVGEGYSSPIVAGGHVFVHSRRDPDEFVTAVEIATGRIGACPSPTTGTRTS